MIIIKSINKLKKEVNFKARIGFVPTMGSLHRGHLSLIESSKKRMEKTIVSIYVNPTQFNNKKDFIKYPRNIKKDIKLLKKMKVDYVFIPNFKDIYNKKNKKKFKISNSDKILCANYRKGHFEGVLGIINSLLKLIKAKYMFLGEKDYQQIYLIKKFIKKKFKIKIISCKTIRNNNLVAYSSRNVHLNKNEIKKTSILINKIKKFYNLLKKDFTLISQLKFLRNDIKNYCTKIEYLEIRNKINLSKKINKKNFKIFVAFYIGNIRLIDNF